VDRPLVIEDGAAGRNLGRDRRRILGNSTRVGTGSSRSSILGVLANACHLCLWIASRRVGSTACRPKTWLVPHSSSCSVCQCHSARSIGSCFNPLACCPTPCCQCRRTYALECP